MKFKDGVKFDLLSPALVMVLHAAERVYDRVTRNSDDHEMTVTALFNGDHLPDSQHYHGNAVDIRAHDLDADTAASLRAELDVLLSPLGCTVLLEDAGTENCHIHIQLYKAGTE
jgi:hypothetical protein